MDDGDLTAFGGLNHLAEGSCIGIGDDRLLVVVVGEHPVVDLGAFITGRAPGRFDIGIIRRRRRLIHLLGFLRNSFLRNGFFRDGGLPPRHRGGGHRRGTAFQRL